MYAIKKHLFLKWIGMFCLLLTYQYTICKEGVLISKQEFVSLMHEQENDILYGNSATQEELLQLRAVNSKKAWTIVIYIAADNDLHPFAWKNIKQMEAIGSNENINVIVQLNTPGYLNPTKRYVIKSGKRLLVPADGAALTQKLNSGSPHTLIDCAAWAMKHYPADNLIINLWDHGSGVYDPGTARIINSSDLFRFNEITNMLELKHIAEYSELMNQGDEQDYRQNARGICFDETFKSYMTNQDLKFALSEIQNKVLNGKKIAVLWFDACLMAMLEIANLAKDHVEYLVASEEVEYASGSNYELVLRPFVDKALTAREFACHVVNSYEKAYQYITRDYTQSAMDLSGIAQLEANVSLVAGQILSALQDQKNNSVAKLLQQCKARPFCACFEEPSYIDLRNFYMNLQANINTISLTNAAKEASVKLTLRRLIDQGVNLINSIVIANKVGSNQQRAGGISIYFPERGMFNSYPRCNFAQTNNWSTMLTQYLLSKK
jgi:hypothetical protein